MTYASEIPIKLITQLVSILEERINVFDNVGKLFYIQYSYFELINDEWILKNFLDIGNEILSEISLDINDDREFTNFATYAENPNFDVLRIGRLLDMRNKSEVNKIYACDLYIDFEPQHFVGKCYTSIKKN
jgi:hypothetical protein